MTFTELYLARSLIKIFEVKIHVLGDYGQWRIFVKDFSKLCPMIIIYCKDP